MSILEKLGLRKKVAIKEVPKEPKYTVCLKMDNENRYSVIRNVSDEIAIEEINRIRREIDQNKWIRVMSGYVRKDNVVAIEKGRNYQVDIL